MVSCATQTNLFRCIAGSRSETFRNKKTLVSSLTLATAACNISSLSKMTPKSAVLLAGISGRTIFASPIISDGRKLHSAIEDNRYDLVLLDLMLPGEDGLSVCRWLRAKSTLPVIIVTAKGDELDRIVGLEMGADDYLAKPFNPRELLARIRAVLAPGERRCAAFDACPISRLFRLASGLSASRGDGSSGNADHANRG